MRDKKVTALLWAFVIFGVFVFISFFSLVQAAVVYGGGGESILNSLTDAKGMAYQIDQTNHLGITQGGYRYGTDIGYLNLGHQNDGHGVVLKTDGIFALYRVSDHIGPLSTFAGVGPYLCATTVPTGSGTYQDQYNAALMFSLGAEYRIGAWRLRASWERLTTFRSFDEDIILLGVGHTL